MVKLSRLLTRRKRKLTTLVDANGRPQMNALTASTANIDIMALNIKAMGYQLARSLGDRFQAVSDWEPARVELGCRLSTQADIESEWFAYWCAQLKIAPFYHRKLWEFAYALQTLWQEECLEPGRRSVRFGCGTEPMASYLASRGVDALITDLEVADARSKGWVDTSQHTAGIDHAWASHLVDRPRFDRHVRHRAVDMNAIPDDIRGFDFCWSICALEHLGSIERGLAFIENSLSTLKPGGLAVHTTEFNINPDGGTIDNWPTVLFQRRHIEQLARQLAARGHAVAPLNFDTGDLPLDQFIDLPPWHDGTFETISKALGQPLHLKVAADGFISTCIGLAVRRAA